jgi:hypothetical protein
MRSFRTVSFRFGALAVAGVSALGVYGFSTTSPAHAAQSSAAAQAVPQDKAISALSTITRAQVLARAKTWHPHTSQRVPYSQARTHGGYRTDCSGYASMALALPKPGPNTVGLASSRYTTRIAMSQLRSGDLVIDAAGSSTTRHVVIFVKWANSKHTAYWEYEQRGHYGTDYRTRSYGLTAGSQYHAYRPKNIR